MFGKRLSPDFDLSCCVLSGTGWAAAEGASYTPSKGLGSYKRLANLSSITDEVLKLVHWQQCFPQLIKDAKSCIHSGRCLVQGIVDNGGVLSSLGWSEALFLAAVPLDSRVQHHTLLCLIFVPLGDCKHAKVIIRIVTTLNLRSKQQ